MPKFGFFWYSKIDIFACTIRKGWPCFDWYLEASKTGNNRVTSSQQINKKKLEIISKLKRLLALTLPGLRSGQTGTSCWTFMAFGFLFLGITLPHFGGTLATWLLISGHLFVFCFIWSVTPGWWNSASVWFCSFSLSAQTSGINCLNSYGNCSL